MIEYHIDKRESNDTWALAAIALLSGGAIRASTEAGFYSMLSSELHCIKNRFIAPYSPDRKRKQTFSSGRKNIQSCTECDLYVIKFLCLRSLFKQNTFTAV